MRIIATTALVLATSGWLVAPLSSAAADPERASGDCTIVGTPGDDVLRGTKKDDFICGLGGDDRIKGRGGDDVLRGGQGDDTIEGGPGDDVLSGGRGDDHLDAQDLPTDRDRLRCGRGKDTTVADVRDRVHRDCENIDQDNAAPTDLALAPASVAENRPAGTSVGTLTAIDADAGDEHTFALVAGAGSADNGSFSIAGATLRTAASLDHEATSTLSIRVRATDVLGLTVEKQLTVTVTDADDPPVAVDDTKTVVEDDPATAIDVLANDTDTDGGPKNVASVTQPAHGTVVITGGGNGLTYAPAANYCNTPTPPFDTFTYTLNGGDAGSVAVTVTCVDDLPVANDDAKTITEDAAATVIDVLANDSDPEGDPFSISGTTQPVHGTVTHTASTVSYTPAADYCTDPPPLDTFTYTITGGDTATVTMTVSCVNDPPVAVDDTKAATEDTPLTFSVVDILSNDIEVDEQPDFNVLSVTAVSNASGGSVELISLGTQVRFAPATDVCGPGAGSFDYTVSDDFLTDIGHVSVDIGCVNDAPVATDDTVTGIEDTPLTITKSSLTANDTDPDGESVSITSTSDVGGGSLAEVAGSFVFTPDPGTNLCGVDVADFDYEISDGHGGVDTGRVSINLTCVNDVPVVDLDTGQGGAGSDATFNETSPHSGTGVLIAPNASVVDVDDPTIVSLTVVLTGRPDGDAFESLSATIPGASGITGGTYVPATGTLSFSGSAPQATYAAVIASIRYDNTKAAPSSVNRTITVVVNDGDVDSATATATIQVVPINAPPVNTVPGAQTTDEDTSKPISGISVDDADNPASLTVQLDVTHGTVTVSAAGLTSATGNGTGSATLVGSIAALNTALATLTYTPASNYNGPAQLTIATTDGLATDTDNIALAVTAINDQPSATNLSAGETYTEDATKDLVDIVVSDVDSTNVTATLTLSTPTAGSLSTGTSGTVTSTYVAGTGVWTASGPIPDVNTLLAGVTFTPAADFNAGFTIATGVTDGVAAPTTGSKAMTGTAVNDAPTVTAPASATVDEDVDLVFTGGNLISVADVDAGAGSVQVTLTTTNGTMTLSGTAGLTVTGQGTGLLTASGTITNLNTALASSKFRGTLNYNGPASVAVDVSDLGNTPAPPLTASKAVAITVSPVNDAPVADDETFSGANSAIGNTTLVVDDPTDGAPSAAGPKKTITGDILAGDTDVDGPSLSVVAGTFTSGGGTVVMEADGDFTLLPPAGCASSYSFDYTLTDGGTPALTDTGTVTVAVTECVWYVDPAAAAGGDGRSQTPFQTLASLNGAGGAGDVDDDSDYLFVQAGSYGTGLGLESNQRLFGQPHGLTVAATTLVASGVGSNPTISSGSGNGLTLSTGNNVQGVNLGSTPAGNAALAGTAVGIATMNTVTPGSINNTTGGAVDISTGTLAMSFASVSSAGATGDGIRLDNAAGTFTASAGSLQNAGGQDVDLSGNNSSDSVDFTYDGTITDDVGTLVNVSNQSGGIKDFNGAITDGNDGDGNGVSLTSNTGATVRFDGGLVASTGANAAFNATGGGTVVVTDPNANGTAPDNTLTTTTGSALNVVNTTIGGADLTFRSISAGAGGTTPGIVLDTTGATGNLVVTGDGTAAVNASGGTITGRAGDYAEPAMTDGESNALGVSGTNGVFLRNTADPQLTHMTIAGNNASGIFGFTVDGFVLERSTVSSNGNEQVFPDESGVDLHQLTGTLAAGAHPTRIANSTISNNFEKEVVVESFSGTLADLELSTNTISSNGATGAHGDLVQFLGRGTSTMKLTATGGTYTGAAPNTGSAIHGDTRGTLMTVNVSDGTFTNNNVGMEANTDLANTTLNFNFTNNTITGNRAIGINHFDNGNGPFARTVNGKIIGNTVGTAGVLNSGSELGNGIRIQNEGAVNVNILISGNTVQEVQSFPGLSSNIGLGGAVTGGGTTNLTILNNVFDHMNGSRAITLQDNQTPTGPFPTLCTNISGNAFSNVVGQAGDGTYLRLRELLGTVNSTQAAPTAAASAAELDDANGFNDPTKINISGAVSFSQPACALPTN